jgi:hypothetical protein
MASTKQHAPARPGEDHMAEANALVNGDRQAAYGSPLQSYEAQAKVWSGMLADKLKEDLTAEDVVLLLTAMKLRRQAHKPKRDNVVDTHGYMLVLAHVEEGRKARGEGQIGKMTSTGTIAITDHRGVRSTK